MARHIAHSRGSSQVPSVDADEWRLPDDGVLRLHHAVFASARLLIQFGPSCLDAPAAEREAREWADRRNVGWITLDACRLAVGREPADLQRIVGDYIKQHIDGALLRKARREGQRDRKETINRIVCGDTGVLPSRALVPVSTGPLKADEREAMGVLRRDRRGVSPRPGVETPASTRASTPRSTRSSRG
jgi:hypothetical protein